MTNEPKTEHKLPRFLQLDKEVRSEIERIVLIQFFNSSDNSPMDIKNATGIPYKYIRPILNRSINCGTDLKALRQKYVNQQIKK